MIGSQVTSCVGCDVGKSLAEGSNLFVCTADCPNSLRAEMVKEALLDDPRYADLLATITVLESLTGNRFKTSEILSEVVDQGLTDAQIQEKTHRVRMLLWPLLREHSTPEKSTRREFFRRIGDAAVGAVLFEMARHQINDELGVDVVKVEEVPVWLRRLLS